MAAERLEILDAESLEALLAWKEGFGHVLGRRSVQSFLILDACRYRVGHGVPGYLGFCPVSEEIPIPVKGGPSVRAKLGEGGIQSSNAKPGDGGTVKPPATTTQEDFQLTPQQFAQATAPNSLWDIKGLRPVGDPPYIRRPPSNADSHVFFASSTFRDTIDKGQDKKWYPDAAIAFSTRKERA